MIQWVQITPSALSTPSGAIHFQEAEPQPVAVVTETVARHLWPDENPIGKKVRHAVDRTKSHWFTVIGVVGDVHSTALDRPPDSVIYYPYWQKYYQQSSGENILALYVRTPMRPTAVAATIRQHVRNIDLVSDRDEPLSQSSQINKGKSTWTLRDCASNPAKSVAVYASRSMMSAEAAFTVNDLPRVSLTRPRAQTVHPLNRAITLQVTASDDGNISRVDFWYSREQRHWLRIGTGSRNGNVYQRSWTPTQAGNYKLYAQAFDDQGFARFSVLNVRVAPANAAIADLSAAQAVEGNVGAR